MAAKKTKPAVNHSASSSTGVKVPAPNFEQTNSNTLLSTIGFGKLDLSNLTFVNPSTREVSERDS